LFFGEKPRKPPGRARCPGKRTRKRVCGNRHYGQEALKAFGVYRDQQADRATVLCKDAYKIASQFFRSAFYGLISPRAARGIEVEIPQGRHRADRGIGAESPVFFTGGTPVKKRRPNSCCYSSSVSVREVRGKFSSMPYRCVPVLTFCLNSRTIYFI
jgi:hypothetical protein